MNAVQANASSADDLGARLNELRLERDEANRKISILKDELRLQEEHFLKQTATQAEYYSKLVEKSVQGEQKVTELMTKMTLEAKKPDNSRLTEEAYLLQVQLL